MKQHFSELKMMGGDLKRDSNPQTLEQGTHIVHSTDAYHGGMIKWQLTVIKISQLYIWKANLNVRSDNNMLLLSSMTRLGDLLHFGQLFKAFGNNYFDQISHILRQFL